VSDHQEYWSEREKEWLVGISQHGNISKAYYDKLLEPKRKRKERRRKKWNGKSEKTLLSLYKSLKFVLYD
jgi:hypothetical protein